MITGDEYLAFADRALDGMCAIVGELGDGLANTAPDIEGANSPYVILHHCLGVVDYWIGHLVMGRPTNRDRPSEFTASGPVDELVSRVATTRARLAVDTGEANMRAPLRRRPPRDVLGPDFELTCGSAFLHVYEELAQHHGQMQIVRDVLRAR